MITGICDLSGSMYTQQSLMLALHEGSGSIGRLIFSLQLWDPWTQGAGHLCIGIYGYRRWSYLEDIRLAQGVKPECMFGSISYEAGYDITRMED